MLILYVKVILTLWINGGNTAYACEYISVGWLVKVESILSSIFIMKIKKY